MLPLQIKQVEFKPAEIKPLIGMVDVEKLDVRVGTILSVSDVENASKLVKLTVSFGNHVGVAGIFGE